MPTSPVHAPWKDKKSELRAWRRPSQASSDLLDVEELKVRGTKSLREAGGEPRGGRGARSRQGPGLPAQGLALNC